MMMPSLATAAATRAIWIGVTSTWAWPYDAFASSTRSANPPGSGPVPPVTWLVSVGRSYGIGPPNPSDAAQRTSSAPPVASPASA